MGDILKPFYLNPIALVRLISFKTVKFRKRKFKYSFISLFSIFLFLTPFQNCKGTKFGSNEIEGLSNMSSTDGASAIPGTDNNSGSNGGTGSTGNTGNTGGGGTTTSSPEIEKQINELCLANASLPVIDSLETTDANNEVLFNSGLSTSGGTTIEKTVKVNFRKTVKDQTVETKNNCSRRIILEVTTALAADATHVPQLSNAISYANENLAATRKASDIGQNIIRMTTETVMDSSNTMGGTIRVRPFTENNNNFLRCAEGSLWLSVRVLQYISGQNNGSGNQSEAKFVKVNLKNTCLAQQKLVESISVSQLSQLGAKVSGHGEWLAALAPNESKDSSNLSVGGVHIFRNSNGSWAHSTTLFPQTTEKGLGLSDVVLHGDKLFISSAFINNQNGSVFYYRLINNVWTPQQEIRSPLSGDTLFGTSLAFNGTTLFVGAPNHLQRGSVLAFIQSGAGTFGYIKSFEPTGHITDEMAYGQSLAVGGSTQTKLLVGAPQSKLNSSVDPGKVFVLETADTNYQKGVITPKGAIKGINGQRFGLSLVITASNQIVIGSPELLINGRAMAGGITFYSSLDSAMTTSEANMKVLFSTTASTQFGTAVALTQNYLYVSAPETNASPMGVSRSGRVLRYALSTIMNATPTVLDIFPTDHTANSFFGSSLVMIQNSLVVGARLKSNPNRDSGAVYVYQVSQ